MAGRLSRASRSGDAFLLRRSWKISLEKVNRLGVEPRIIRLADQYKGDAPTIGCQLGPSTPLCPQFFSDLPSAPIENCGHGGVVVPLQYITSANSHKEAVLQSFEKIRGVKKNIPIYHPTVSAVVLLQILSHQENYGHGGVVRYLPTDLFPKTEQQLSVYSLGLTGDLYFDLTLSPSRHCQ